MADEFPETDLETPTEHDVDEAYGSRFLGVVDVGNKKIRTKILKARKEEVKDRDSGRMKKKILVFFENIDKPLVLNVTNKNVLTDALGRAPAGWYGASVGILVDPNVGFGGKKTGGVRLHVLLPPAAAAAAAAAKPAPKPEPTPPPAKPAPKPAAAKSETSAWSEEAGDPGPNPSMADFEPAE
jgi:hypothetical protein